MNARVAPLAALALLAACQGDEPVSLGRFRVVATRATLTCGPQSMSFDPRVEYVVDLGVRQGALRWQPSGATTVTGSWSAPSRAFRVVLEQDIAALPPDRRLEYPGCALRRADVIEGVVDFEADGGAGDGGAQVDGGAGDGGAGAPRATSFRGTETIVFGALPGSDCRPLIGAAEGTFSTLPCEVTYRLEATRM